MKKSLIFGILIIFLLSVISAQVTIVENPIDISGKVGETQIHNITIVNNFDFDVFDLQFGNLIDLGFDFGNIIVPKNSSESFEITIIPTQSFSGQRQENVKFYYFVNLSEDITTYNINFKEEFEGLNQTFIRVRKGDTIVWHNSDNNINHNVYIPSLGIDSGIISPNQTFSYIFNADLGTYNYYDKDYEILPRFHGSIQIIGRTSQEKVSHQPYDFTWNLNINFFLTPTNLKVEFDDEKFQIQANKETESRITIVNDGNEIAEKINLSSDSNWIFFQENNFNLDPTQKNYVIYKISPIMFDTEETNKTYNITIKIKGSNTEAIEKTISVFIPFADIFLDEDSPEFVFGLLENLCKKSPGNPLCIIKYCIDNPTNPQCTGESTGNATGNQSLNITIRSADFIDFLRRLGLIDTTITRQGNRLGALEDNYDTKLANIESNVSASYQRQLDNERDINRSRTLRWIGGFFIFIMVVTGTIFWKLRRVKRFENIMGGHFKYRI